MRTIICNYLAVPVAFFIDWRLCQWDAGRNDTIRWQVPSLNRRRRRWLHVHLLNNVARDMPKFLHIFQWLIAFSADSLGYWYAWTQDRCFFRASWSLSSATRVPSFYLHQLFESAWIHFLIPLLFDENFLTLQAIQFF